MSRELLKDVATRAARPHGAGSESKIIDAYNATTESFDAQKIDGPQAADQMERTELPAWHAAQSKLERQSNAWLVKDWNDTLIG